MAIQYALYENNLTSDPEDFLAMVQSAGTLDMEMIITRILGRGSTVTREDVLATVDAYHETIIEALLEGVNVNTPVANYRASIKGVFNGATDAFDPNRHSLEPSVSPGAELRNRFSEGEAQKIEADRPSPNLTAFYDFGTSTANQMLTPGNGARLNGHRLKVDPEDATQGVFFVAADGSGETRVAQLMSNKPAELLFIIPTLSSGNYRLQVRALFGTNLRSGELDKVLTVA